MQPVLVLTGDVAIQCLYQDPCVYTRDSYVRRNRFFAAKLPESTVTLIRIEEIPHALDC